VKVTALSRTFKFRDRSGPSERAGPLHPFGQPPQQRSRPEAQLQRQGGPDFGLFRQRFGCRRGRRALSQR